MSRIALFAVLAACGGSGSGGTYSDAGTSSDAGGYPYSPMTVQWGQAAESSAVMTTIAAGTPVRWHNGGDTVHAIEPEGSQYPAATGNIAPGDTSAEQTITTPGTYHYRCGIHPWMHGTLTVTQ
jgi:plastocyanin